MIQYSNHFNIRTFPWSGSLFATATPFPSSGSLFVTVTVIGVAVVVVVLVAVADAVDTGAAVGSDGILV